ncbi:hypothetical protein J6590_098084, partial [Homalodisca vitripennis]
GPPGVRGEKGHSGPLGLVGLPKLRGMPGPPGDKGDRGSVEDPMGPEGPEDTSGTQVGKSIDVTYRNRIVLACIVYYYIDIRYDTHIATIQQPSKGFNTSLSEDNSHRLCSYYKGIIDNGCSMAGNTLHRGRLEYRR